MSNSSPSYTHTLMSYTHTLMSYTHTFDTASVGGAYKEQQEPTCVEAV